MFIKVPTQALCISNLIRENTLNSLTKINLNNYLKILNLFLEIYIRGYIY